MTAGFCSVTIWEMGWIDEKKIIALLVPETPRMSALNTYKPISRPYKSSHRSRGQNFVGFAAFQLLHHLTRQG